MQMTINRCESRVKVLIILCILLIAALGIYAVRGLYADGSVFLYDILSKKTYCDFDKPRAFVQIIIQTPVVIGIKLGVKDITKLIYLYNLGMVGIPVLLWFFSLYQHLKSGHFWTLLIAFSATYLSSGFFAIGEYNLTYSLAAYCFAVLLKEKITYSDSIFIVAAAISLTRSYEAMVFLGPFFFVFSAKKLIGPELDTTLRGKFILLILLFLFAAATTIATWSIFFPRDPGNLAGALDIFPIVKSGYFIFLASMILVYFIIQFLPRKARIFLALVSIASAACFTIDQRIWNSPWMNYGFRSISGLMLLTIFCVTFFMILNKKHKFIKIYAIEDSAKFQKIVSLALFLSLAFSSATYSLGFSKWIKNFEFEAGNASSWIHIDEVKSLNYSGPNSDFNWNWTNPALSIILRGDSAGGILNRKDYMGWQPFKPEDIQGNPLGYFSKESELYILK